MSVIGLPVGDTVCAYGQSLSLFCAAKVLLFFRIVRISNYFFAVQDVERALNDMKLFVVCGVSMLHNQDTQLIQEIQRHSNQQQGEHIRRRRDDSGNDTQHYESVLAILTQHRCINQPQFGKEIRHDRYLEEYTHQQ